MTRWVLATLGLLSAGAAWALGRFPEVAEAVYGSGPGLWIPRTLSRLTGWSGVALAPFLLGGLVLVAGALAVRDYRRARGKGSGRGRSVVLAAGWPLGLAGALATVFYLAWGFNYARPPLERRLGLETADSIESLELETLAREAVSQANAYYLLLHGVEDAGEPTALPFDLEEGSRILQVGWGALVEEMALPEIVASRYGPVKAAGVTRILEAFDIAGVFSPFTGEALINGGPPAVSLPAVMAHEQAHQRGFAPEDEASFMGIMASLRSEDVMARYSGWARLVRRFAADLQRADPDARTTVVAELLPGVRRDWQDWADYWTANRSRAAPVARAVNDRYLRAHGVEGGILSYGLVTRLLVAWARAHGGSLAAG